MPPDTITPVTAILKEASLTFVYAYTQDELAQALDLLATGHHVKIIVQPGPSGRSKGARAATGTGP